MSTDRSLPARSTEAQMWADLPLVRRVEAAERSLIEEAAVASARRARPVPIFVRDVGDGSAVWAGADSPLNKVVGAGVGDTVTDHDLAAVERAFAERATPVHVELPTAADPELFERLSRRGYVVVGFENVLGLSLDPARRAAVVAGVDVSEVGADDFETWLRVDVDASLAPDVQGVPTHEDFPRESLEDAVRDLAATTGFVGTIARVDGLAVGSGSMRLHAGIAQLCGAATLPEFRRRGVQSALLSARLARAASAGCEMAVVTVQPASKSEQNVYRQGFRILYARCVLRRDPSTRS